LSPELAECLSLGHVGVQVQHVVKVSDSVAETVDAEVFVAKWIQMQYLLYTA